MKTNRFMLLLAFMSLVFMTSLVAQEMTKDQWQSEIASYTQKRADLQVQMKKLTDEITSFKTQTEKLDADLKACEDALYALLGVSKADIDAFDQELTDMEKRVAELQRMSDAELLNHKDELEKMNNRLGEMAKSKIAFIPRYGDRVKALQDKVAALMSGLQKEKTYTVGTWSRDRDCLWNISKKKDIYNNAWMWPKIWQGNRDKIKDPDVIKPKWILRIPEGKELSKQEKSAANSYYHKKIKAAEPTTK